MPKSLKVGHWLSQFFQTFIFNRPLLDLNPGISTEIQNGKDLVGANQPPPCCDPNCSSFGKEHGHPVDA